MEFHKDIRSFDSSASALAFPLGGIGTGNVSLGARGELRDWEIFNTPAKGKSLPLTFFAIRCRQAGNEPMFRVLEGPVQPPHTPSHGYHPMMGVAGLPRFKSSTFRGQYPFAAIDFEDASLPVAAQLEAYTPLIPLNPEDSGVPCAIFTYTISNRTDDPVDITVLGSLTNPVGNLLSDQFGNNAWPEFGRQVNEFHDDGNIRGLKLTNDELASDSLHFGSVSLVTDHDNVTYRRTWLRGEWWDYLHNFCDDLIDDGLLDDPADDAPGEHIAAGSLGLVDRLEPGESKQLRFILSWHFPNRPKAWDLNQVHMLSVDVATVGIMRNQYATRFEDAWDAASYVCRESQRLDSQTRLFHDALFSSALPPAVLDAVSANIVPLRSTTCFWLEDGRFYGWEGCFDDVGCCPGSCTHVWSYAYSLAYLFPSLEREMRRIEFNVETADDGFMRFRSFGTFHDEFVWQGRTDAAVDGQMGSILRVYREWQLSGDRSFLAELWPGVKRAIGFASSYWDSDNDHVLDGVQHNTYDIEFHGPNPLCGIYYLAALRAVEEMALIMDEDGLSRRCREAFETGRANLDALLWNGEYYVQRLDDVNAQKYQHGLGCLSDQLLGQLHASLLGLGDLLPGDRVRGALKSIFDHNFKGDFSEHLNCQRVYTLNDEAGLLLCTWPGGSRPNLPFPYADEVWTGIEYQVAAHLIHEGWVDEGLQIVEAVRARHDGVRRNPWNEVECGNHYARSMSSWALLLALSGAQVDPANGNMSFPPGWTLATEDKPFQSFWSNGRAWGTYAVEWDEDTQAWWSRFEVLGGDSNVTGGIRGEDSSPR
ncbi:MAG: GH116 family glycosyl-hydrolase [Chloroflexi bacterium]|nr:GH116 family glycosyl-hydrolase [Chloroflexota bacterium]